jgi:hypothetical protein
VDDGESLIALDSLVDAAVLVDDRLSGDVVVVVVVVVVDVVALEEVDALGELVYLLMAVEVGDVMTEVDGLVVDSDVVEDVSGNSTTVVDWLLDVNEVVDNVDCSLGGIVSVVLMVDGTPLVLLTAQMLTLLGSSSAEVAFKSIWNIAWHDSALLQQVRQGIEFSSTHPCNVLVNVVQPTYNV